MALLQNLWVSGREMVDLAKIAKHAKKSWSFISLRTLRLGEILLNTIPENRVRLRARQAQKYLFIRIGGHGEECITHRFC